MPDRVIGPNTVSVDLIDDAHVDTVTFHDSLGDELHRAAVVGRETIAHHYDGPDGRTVQARAWVGDVCVYEFAVLAMFRGSIYTVSWDE